MRGFGRLRTVKQLIEKLKEYPEDLKIVTEPYDHTYWQGIDVGSMKVEVWENGDFVDTLDEEGENIKEVLFVGVN